MNMNFKVGLTLLFLMLPLIVMAQQVIGVLTATWPECREISADVMREAGFRRSMTDGFTDADGVLLVTYTLTYWERKHFSSVRELERDLDTTNLALMYLSMGDPSLTRAMYSYHVCLYSKDSEGGLSLVYHQKL